MRKSIPEINDLFQERSKYLHEQQQKDVFDDLESDCSEEIDEEVLAA